MNQKPQYRIEIRIYRDGVPATQAAFEGRKNAFQAAGSWLKSSATLAFLRMFED